jgi:hypothetical protein
MGSVESAKAVDIGKGSDYLHTPAGFSFFEFPGIGRVDFVGLPVGIGNTDTIIERQADCIFVNGSCTIPIELTLLSMKSVNPVDVGGSLFDVFVGLTPNTNSTGTMTINHEFPDNDTPAPEGTFTSDFTVFFDAVFQPINNGQQFTVSDSATLINSGSFWSHEPPPGAVLVRGIVGDQAANCHDPISPLCARGNLRDFFPVRTSHGKPGGDHTTDIATVPEPTTMLGLGIGLGFSTFLRKKYSRQGKKQAVS